jgi:hypothetical protein
MALAKHHEEIFERRCANGARIGIGLSESRYLTKGEAAELSGAPWGHILDLENIYGGLLLRGSYLFISEETVSDGLRRYGSDFTLSLLIDDIARERAAA